MLLQKATSIIAVLKDDTPLSSIHSFMVRMSQFESEIEKAENHLSWYADSNKLAILIDREPAKSELEKLMIERDAKVIEMNDLCFDFLQLHADRDKVLERDDVKAKD